MSPVKSWHRAILFALALAVGVAILAWIARTDSAINYLSRHREAIRDSDSVKLSENILTALRADLPYSNKPEE